jgi:alcohol dehydrogenase class IV
MKILPAPEIYIGKSSLEQINNILNKINATKILVVTDKGIVNAGIYAKLEAILNKDSRQIVFFDEVQPDPSIKLVEQVVKIARNNNIDAVIGLGGGSSIDTAKVAAALVTNDKEMASYIGIELLEKDALPIIAIPTTAGTGSEVTHIAILSDEKEQLKKGIVSSRIIPKFAILDPELTVGLPPHVTAATGMDALVHALEAYISINAYTYSDTLALRAIGIISENIREAYNNGKNLEARENMLLGSLLAGIAFANAGVAAVHAFAYPLGGMFHIPHGLANSVMLPTIMKFNMTGNEIRFTEMAKHLTNNSNSTAQDTIKEIYKLCEELKIPLSLAELNIPESAISQLAESVMKVTRLLANNPRKITYDDAIKLYTSAYKGGLICL